MRQRGGIGMIVLAVESSIQELKQLEACIRHHLPNAEIHGFVNGLMALEWAKEHPVDIAFGQYTSMEQEVEGVEGAVVANQLYVSGKCKNIILCGNEIEFSMDAWNSDASFFYKKPVSRQKIGMALNKLRYPIEEVPLMDDQSGVTKNHLTKKWKGFLRKR